MIRVIIGEAPEYEMEEDGVERDTDRTFRARMALRSRINQLECQAGFPRKQLRGNRDTALSYFIDFATYEDALMFKLKYL